MTRYHWKGPGKMKRVDQTRTETPELTEPESAEVNAGDDERTRLHMCIAPTTDGPCKRKFKKRMLVARHFNASHDTLREDSDSWREFVEEIWTD